MLKELLAGLICFGLVAGAVGCGSGKPICVGSGLSELEDAHAAGAEAAQKAKAALGAASAEVVIVYNGSNVRDTAKMLEGVGSVFDSSLIYGCGGYSPLTQEGSAGRVAVLALGGVEVTAVRGVVEGGEGHKDCGVQIGNALKTAAGKKDGGRLLLVFGDCHVPKNDNLVVGLRSVLGDDFAVVGGAAHGGTVYEKGKAYEKSNIGLLLTGDFECGFSMKEDMSADGLINSAREAFAEAIGRKRENVRLVLVFDCGGRRGEMLKNKNFPQELEAMKSVAGDICIFGFYGSGEIGRADSNSPARGVGYSIATCAISSK